MAVFFFLCLNVPEHVEEAVPCLSHAVVVHLDGDQDGVLIRDFERWKGRPVGETQQSVVGTECKRGRLKGSRRQKDSRQATCDCGDLEVRAHATRLHCSTTGGWCLQLASISRAVFQYGGVGKQRAHASSHTSNSTAISFSASFSATPTATGGAALIVLALAIGTRQWQRRYLRQWAGPVTCR